MSDSCASCPIRVLVVDDDPDGRELLSEYFTFLGWTVHVAGDGQQAVETIRQVRPEIVLMDLEMPGLNGWDATQIIKTDPGLPSIVVIAVTAHALPRDTDAAIDAGCDGVICKPVDIMTLADALPRLLQFGATALDIPGICMASTWCQPCQRQMPESM